MKVPETTETMTLPDHDNLLFQPVPETTETPETMTLPDHDNLLFQENPSRRPPGLYRAQGWKSTIHGYFYESDKLSRLILWNRRYQLGSYTWAVTIKIREVSDWRVISDMWKKVCRKLRAGGFVGLWVVEPHRDNTVHYHIMASSHHGERRALERLIESSMPCRSEMNYHKQVAPIKSEYHWGRYITKARTRGVFGVRPVEDKYSKKRLLFVEDCKLQKSREIGSFWNRPKNVLWKEIIALEQKISDGLSDPRVGDLAEHFYKWADGTISRNRVRRAFGFSADKAVIKDWVREHDREELNLTLANGWPLS